MLETFLSRMRVCELILLFLARMLAAVSLQSSMAFVPQWASAATINEHADKPPCTKIVVPGESIQKLLYKVAGGDVICVRPGTYHETISVTASGTASAPIIIRGDGGRPIIDGQFTLPKENTMDYSRPRQGCPGIVDGRLPSGLLARQRFECSGYYPLVRLGGDYITFEGFEVVNSTGAGISAVARTTKTNITIRNNHVHSVRDNGIFLWQILHALVEHNEVADTGNFAPFWRPGSTLVWGAGIGAYASHFVRFNANVVHDNWGDALLVDINTGGSTDITVENNIFYDNYSSNGVYAHAVKRLSMQRNLIYCATENPLHSWSSLAVAPMEPQYAQNIDTDYVTVTNNIFAGCPTAGILLWDTKPPVRVISNLVFANNTIYGDGEGISLKGSSDTFLKNFSLSNNLIVNGALSVSGFTSSNNQIYTSANSRLMSSRMMSSGDGTGLMGMDGKGRFPSVFVAGRVDPQWFRVKLYNGVGADVSGFAKAGLLSEVAP